MSGIKVFSIAGRILFTSLLSSTMTLPLAAHDLPSFSFQLNTYQTDCLSSAPRALSGQATEARSPSRWLTAGSTANRFCPVVQLTNWLKRTDSQQILASQTSQLRSQLDTFVGPQGMAIVSRVAGGFESLFAVTAASRFRSDLNVASPRFGFAPSPATNRLAHSLPTPAPSIEPNISPRLVQPSVEQYLPYDLSIRDWRFNRFATRAYDGRFVRARANSAPSRKFDNHIELSKQHFAYLVANAHCELENFVRTLPAFSTMVRSQTQTLVSRCIGARDHALATIATQAEQFAHIWTMAPSTQPLITSPLFVIHRTETGPLVLTLDQARNFDLLVDATPFLLSQGKSFSQGNSDEIEAQFASWWNRLTASGLYEQIDGIRNLVQLLRGFEISRMASSAARLIR